MRFALCRETAVADQLPERMAVTCWSAEEDKAKRQAKRAEGLFFLHRHEVQGAAANDEQRPWQPRRLGNSRSDYLPAGLRRRER